MVTSKSEFEKIIKELLIKAAPCTIFNDDTLSIINIQDDVISYKIRITNEDFKRQFILDSNITLSGKEYFDALVQNLYMDCEIHHVKNIHYIIIYLKLE